VGLDPAYLYLREVQVPAPDYDSRLQDLVATETLSQADQTLTTTWSAPLRDAASLKLAVANKSADIINQFVQARGIQNPSDMLDLLSLLSARVDGQTLPSADQARLDNFGQSARTYVTAVKSRAQALAAWIDAHPGLTPPIDSGWPEVPQP
jgi:hypothetical protein